MKSYFLKLFKYDHFANNIILKSVIESDQPQRALELMAHLLAAQQIWLNRCKNLPVAGIDLWPDWTTDSFAETINENHNNWISFINELNPGEFHKIISYNNSKGDSYENLLEDILAHVINHGTHHRAQIGQQLKLAGLQQLPNTDYIFYMR